MYLSQLVIKNFRCFDGCGHTVNFHKGLNIIVGENDSGKTAIIDAIRYVLGTTDQKWQRFELTDFYNEDKKNEILITCRFTDLSIDERGAFLECLTYNSGVPELFINWTAKFMTSIKPSRVITNFSCGKNGDSAPPASEARELIRATYLRALRDSYSEMQSGKNSRLSQIVDNVVDVHEGIHEYRVGDVLEELSLAGIVDLSNQLLGKHPKLKSTNKKILSILENGILLKNENVKTRLTVTGSDASNEKRALTLLEKLDLSVDQGNGKLGLGTSNILSMACELLLNQANDRSSFLLIEEPEAHIHAQRQVKLLQSLQNQVSDSNQQTFITTHSPLLTSVSTLENIILVKNSKTYPMASEYTMLDQSDYKFLERYLDATKANLFFAKSVLIVEGPGEELLLPTIASLLGRGFTDYGVSLVNVMSTGLRRYSRIFQRSNETDLLDIKVACVTDRDVLPDCAPKICLDEKYENKDNWPKKNRRWKTESEIPNKEEYMQSIKDKANGQHVKTFVATYWTLEYDLALSGFHEEIIEALANLIVINSTQSKKEKEFEGVKSEIISDLNLYNAPEERASFIYSFFSNKIVSKAEFAQQFAEVLNNRFSKNKTELRKKIPQYLIDAIEYVTEVLPSEQFNEY